LCSFYRAEINMSNRSLPSAYIKSVLHNGVGRYVCQMSRITFKFCKSKGDSRGVRSLAFLFEDYICRKKFTADSVNQLLIFREFSRKHLFTFWLYVVKVNSMVVARQSSLALTPSNLVDTYAS